MSYVNKVPRTELIYIDPGSGFVTKDPVHHLVVSPDFRLQEAVVQ